MWINGDSCGYMDNGIRWKLVEVIFDMESNDDVYINVYNGKFGDFCGFCWLYRVVSIPSCIPMVLESSGIKSKKQKYRFNRT